MTSKDKITDIQYLINEFYSTDEDRGELNESAKASRKIFNQYCKDIRKDLEVLEILKNKEVDLTYLRNLITLSEGDEFNEYNKNCGIAYIPLTEEEFKKIEEWLKDE